MFVVERDAGGRKRMESSLRWSKPDKIVTRASGERGQDFGMSYRFSVRRLSVDKRSRRSAGKGMPKPSTRISFKRGADPRRNSSMTSGSVAFLDSIRMNSSAGNGTCIMSAID